METLYRMRVQFALCVCACVIVLQCVAYADGHVKAPFDYKGSLEERSQEAVLIFDSSTGKGIEDLILKISVQGNVDRFAWVIPFPNQPAVKEADARIFKELFNYVEYNLGTGKFVNGKKFGGGGFGGGAFDAPVEVLSRELVGSYDVAVVKENVSGSLNQWLSDEGYQRIDNGGVIIEEYRQSGFVFCCIKVSEATATGNAETNLHPLRFTFETGGRDGIYFPMKLTGLQTDVFDVNLYVFSRRQLNARLNERGYEHRGFRYKYRGVEHFRTQSTFVPAFRAFLTEFYPAKRFYLTNLQATQLAPAAIREWKNDLWLFPLYSDPKFVPYDTRRGGPASFE
jgi:hypothetical protein